MLIICLFIIFLFGASDFFYKECAFRTWQPWCFDNDEHIEVLLHLFTKVSFCEHIKSISLQYNAIFVLAASLGRWKRHFIAAYHNAVWNFICYYLKKKNGISRKSVCGLWHWNCSLEKWPPCFQMLGCVCSRWKVKGWWPHLVSLTGRCQNSFAPESWGRRWWWPAVFSEKGL